MILLHSYLTKLYRLWKSYLDHPQKWQFYLTTRITTDSKTFTHVSVPQSRPSITILAYLYTQHVADDKSRVCLTEIPGVEGSDYINASFIDVRKTYSRSVSYLCKPRSEKVAEHI